MNSLLRTFFILSLLLLATFLRFYRIEAQSFWNDEGNSARIAERSLDLILAGAAGDIHPPGYYVLLAGWRAIAGQSEFALRSLSAFAGILLVALVYRLGKIDFDRAAALYATFFAALHPALVYYSQEARMYALAATLAGGSWLLAEAQWQRTVGSQAALNEGRLRVIIRVLSFGTLIAAGLYTHYAFGFVIIALNLFFLIRLVQLAITNYPLLLTKLKPLLSNLFLPQFIALLLFLPWLPIAVRQVTTWPANRPGLSFGEAWVAGLRWLTAGPTANTTFDRPLIIGLAIVLGLSLWRRRTLAPWVWALVPLGLALGLGLISPAFIKVLIVAAPALCLLAGNGAALIRDGWRDRKERSWPDRILVYLKPYILLPLLLPTLALSIGVALNNLYFNPAYARADYRGLVQTLNATARPRDAILLNAPNQWEVFTYYHPDLSAVFPVATSRPLNVPEQVRALEKIAVDHDRLFVVYWGEAQSDPDRVIESWLNAHTFKAYDRWYGEVRLAAYAVPRAAAGLQTRTDVTFGGQIVLDGYSLNATTFSPGDILQLTLFWHAPALITERYKVFVHLVGDPVQPPLAQHDGEPGGGLALTTTWPPGGQVIDNHGVYLPLDLPPGAYSLLIGLYRVEDGRRLTQPGGDTLFISTITMK